MENVLGDLDGVVSVDADYVAGSATVSYNPTQVTPDQMVEAINTQTFFRAGLPDAPGTTAGETNRLPLLPFVAGGVLTLLAGLGVWRIIARRQANRPPKPQTSPPGVS